ncbi:glycosyl transferase [Bombiscardovia coagulans]|uniref:Glycosyl transferase n=2 Tax=Bombiscardovia coagulans TaxID=686666 RepID=A0A261EQM5_9BIFI|nr:glycosyl transferase [Bombiscardovia coagulans]
MTQKACRDTSTVLSASMGKSSETILSFIVPAYNIATYLNRCLSSLLSSRSTDIEVIVVDDGSEDDTAYIANRWAQEQPDLVRVIHQHNKGHGGAVNTGLKQARGLYVKVVDADDWVDSTALSQLLPILRQQAQSPSPVDMVVTNYVYEKEGRSHKHVVNFRSVMTPNQQLRWNQLKPFGITQYMIMHALIFRTDVLHRAATHLPEHTFYVDFLYSYQPLPYVRTLTYLDLNLYRYYTGRTGQSVETSAMISRVDQLLRVTHLMVDATPARASVPDGLYQYMVHYLSINCTVTSVFLILSNKPENYKAKEQLWDSIESSHPQIASDLKHTLLGKLINIPGRPGRLAVRIGYILAGAAVGFN